MSRVEVFEVNYGSESDYPFEEMLKDANIKDGDDVRVSIDSGSVMVVKHE